MNRGTAELPSISANKLQKLKMNRITRCLIRKERRKNWIILEASRYKKEENSDPTNQKIPFLSKTRESRTDWGPKTSRTRNPNQGESRCNQAETGNRSGEGDQKRTCLRSVTDLLISGSERLMQSSDVVWEAGAQLAISPEASSDKSALLLFFFPLPSPPTSASAIYSDGRVDHCLRHAST